MHSRPALLAAVLLAGCTDGTLSTDRAGGSDGDVAGSGDAGFADTSQDAGTEAGVADVLADPATNDGPADQGTVTPDLEADPAADAVAVPDTAMDAPPDLPPADEPEVGPVLPENDAQAGGSFFAYELHPGESGRFNIRLTNTGTATWSQAGGFSLHALGGSDPFHAPVFELGEAVVGPGATYTFELYIFAPDAVGTYFSDWQMHRSGFGLFGDVVSSDVPVVPDPHLCPAPEPPPVDRMNGRIHNDMFDGWKRILDSTPIVYAYGGVYCAEIGYTDGRRYCPPRPEGHPDTAICNEQAVGRDPDSGQAGPNWTFNGQPCLWEGDVDGRCRFHPTNPFLVITFGSGTARVCARNGCCKEIEVP